MLNQFSRSELVFGKDAMERLKNARVAVFGIGGVGGYTVEALAAMPLEKSATLGVDKERDLALRFMEQAKGNSALAAWQQTEEKYLSRIKQLEAEVNSLRAIVRKGKR